MKKTVALLSIILAACGGGGGSDNSNSQQPAPKPTATAIPTATPTATPTPTPVPSPSAVGLWKGESTNKTSNAKRAVTGIVFADGNYYVWYSSTTNINNNAGVLLGSGSVTGSNLIWTGAKDFNTEGSGSILDVTNNVTAVSKSSLKGDSTYTNTSNNSSFTSTYSNDFELTAKLSTVAGTYSGNVSSATGNATANLTISTNGTLTGLTLNNCSVTGTLSARTDANAYNLTLTFGALPCQQANQSITGIAYFDAGQKRLYTAAINANKTDGVLFVGNKP